MEITFDSDKNAKNIRVRGLSFEKAAKFDFSTALYYPDNRRDYGETRIFALGRLGNRVHALVFANIEKGIRVISFRKANKREVRRYEQKNQS
ncbi:MAG: BrnT family toxin [Burkholderiaceae bacterium]|nr:BrnT family toxin [Burkholderiaceae bacterium]